MSAPREGGAGGPDSGGPAGGARGRGARGAESFGGGRPLVSRTNLYSYLVTRPTGRAVRLGIEGRLREYERHVLAVLDFSDVPLIDFSCADEVVAKLALAGLADGPRLSYFLFRGVGDHHRDPIECALERRGLAVAAQSAAGEPLLLGTMHAEPARVWRELWRLGRAPVERLAESLGIGAGRVAASLNGLERRRLLLRDGAAFVSFGHALLEADTSGPSPPAP